MVIALVVIAGAIGTTYVIHMLRTRDDLAVSAAQFFTATQARIQDSFRISWVPLSLQLLLRLGMLGCLLWALWDVSGSPLTAQAGVNLWLVLDTSGSMTTLQGETPRMSLALAEAQAAIEAAAKAADDKPVCIKLSGFDLELYPPDGLIYHDVQSAENGLAQFKARALGTDLSLLLNSIKATSEGGVEDDCPPTHIVVVSDLPAPASGLASETATVLWRDIARPVDNVGFTSVKAQRDPLTGALRAIAIGVRAYGARPETRLTITDPTGETTQLRANWSGDTWVVPWQPERAGTFQLTLEPPDAYALDNQIALNVEAAPPLSVDCELPDCSFIAQLGWQTPQPPLWRLTNRLDSEPDLPTLIVGEGYQPDPTQVQPIIAFHEGHPLLADLNLDVLETIGIRRLNADQVPDGFAPVLMGQDATWIAAREEPRTIWIPGLPLPAPDAPGEAHNWSNASMTLFFNAVRWLVQAQPLQPLYELTNPLFPEVNRTRIALFDGEGDTSQAATSVGTLDDMAPQLVARQEPGWPRYLLFAALLFTLERSLVSMSDRWK